MKTRKIPKLNPAKSVAAWERFFADCKINQRQRRRIIERREDIRIRE